MRAPFRTTRVLLLAASTAMVAAAWSTPWTYAQAVDPAALPAAAAPAAAAPAAPAAPSDPVEQVTQNIRDRQFSPAVKLASKLLSGNIAGTAPLSDGDKYELYMLKGTALVGTHSNMDAIENFQRAAKASQDPHDVAVATWTVQLVRHASGQTYAPKMAVNGQRPHPIDLTDLDARPAAFNAFLADQLAALSPRLESAGNSHSLPPIFNALKQVNDLRALDEVANGNDDTVGKVAGDLLDHAHGLISSALKQMLAREGDIEQYANQVTVVPQTQVLGGMAVTQNISQRNGLSQSNRAELQTMVSNCQKIHDAIDAFGTLAKNSDDWSSLLSDSDRIAGHAKDLLDNLNNVGANGIGGVLPVPNAGNSFPVYPGGYGGYPGNNFPGGGAGNGVQYGATTRPTTRPSR